MLECSSQEEEEFIAEEESHSVVKPKWKKKKSSEVDRLKLNGDSTDLPRLRSQRLASYPFIGCSSVSSWNEVSVGRVHVVSGKQGGSEWPEMDAECLDEENDTYDTIYDNYDEIVFLI